MNSMDGIERIGDSFQEQRMAEYDPLFTRRPCQNNVVLVSHDKLGVIEDGDRESVPQLSMKERKRHKKNSIMQMKIELQKTNAMTEKEVESIRDLGYLKNADRWKLYRYWVTTLQSLLTKQLNELAVEYNNHAKELVNIRNQGNIDVLRTADVVAMTTTGAAKHRELIQKLPVKIMIVEEAAEVLEAHIVTSMPQSTEHLILIGDHQQLKPSPTVYELAKKFNLDMSLFERMVKNGIPCSRLTLQHRMRPRIADLIRPHIYKELNDHKSVLKYPDVSGIEKNVFFISHNYEEDEIRDSTTKANQHEANFIVSLCKYLLQQGYSEDQITILTAYVGQLSAFKKVLSRLELDKKKIRVTAVDNFQGEESDIVLLSLVRSNAEDKIGFLSIENRVCVALSRAKKGLYCIGNFEMLQRKSKLWRNIVDSLKKDGMIGEELTLRCKNHDDKNLQVKCEKDFQNFPEGGCKQPCRFLLGCKHECTRLCHPDDQDHKKFKCMKLCNKLCPAGHTVQTPCCEEPRCMKKVNKVLPKCEHTQEVLCYRDPKSVICRSPCKETLPCGHPCTNVCGRPCQRIFLNEEGGCRQPCGFTLECRHECTKRCHPFDINHGHCMKLCEKQCPKGHIVQTPCCRKPLCRVMVDEVLPHCGHEQKVRCFEDVKNVVCKSRCRKRLSCGHPCKDACGKPCSKRYSRGGCGQRCGFQLECGHECPYPCHLRDKEHKRFTCKIFCVKQCPKGHDIKTPCYQKPICKRIVKKVLLQCGHRQEVFCYQDPRTIICQRRHYKRRLPYDDSITREIPPRKRYRYSTEREGTSDLRNYITTKRRRRQR